MKVQHVLQIFLLDKNVSAQRRRSTGWSLGSGRNVVNTAKFGTIDLGNKISFSKIRAIYTVLYQRLRVQNQLLLFFPIFFHHFSVTFLYLIKFSINYYQYLFTMAAVINTATYSAEKIGRIVAEFVCGLTDLREVPMRRLQLIHDELFYVVNDRILPNQKEGDEMLPHPMAMIFIMDYMEAISEEMEKGIEYWTAVGDYEGATRYDHTMTMWNGDFRTKEQRRVKVKLEEGQC